MVLGLRLLLLSAGFLSVCHGLDVSLEPRFQTIVQSADRSELYELFREMPKGGILHLHSECAVSPHFWLRAATADGRSHVNEYFTKRGREAALVNRKVDPVRDVLWSRGGGQHNRQVIDVVVNRQVLNFLCKPVSSNPRTDVEAACRKPAAFETAVLT